MRIRLIALAGTIAATTVLVAPAVADQTTTSPTPVAETSPVAKAAKFRNSCRPKRAMLQSSVEGRPTSFRRGVTKGLYVWHEKAGWRVRLTHPRTRDAAGKPELIEVRGKVRTSRPMRHIRTVRLEPRQRAEFVSLKRPGRRTMAFRFVNGGLVDGVNFNAGCAGRLAFTAWEITRDADGKVTGRTPLPIFVGATAMEVTDETTPALKVTKRNAARVVALREPV